MPDLSELRQGINDIDKQIEQLFKERMELCVHVAEFKKQNKLQIFQSSREDEILERVKNDMPDWLGGGSQVLFSTLMDISKLLQYQRVFSERDEMSFKPLDLTKPAKAAVPGISGAYAHIACEQFSGNLTPVFCSSFRKSSRPWKTASASSACCLSRIPRQALLYRPSSSSKNMTCASALRQSSLSPTALR